MCNFTIEYLFQTKKETEQSNCGNFQLKQTTLIEIEDEG